MPSGQSLISDIFKKISNVTNLTNPPQPQTITPSTTPSTSTMPPPSIKQLPQQRSIRLKPRSIRSLRSTASKSKKKTLNPYKKKNSKEKQPTANS